jgi:hypothetical protein
MNAFVGLSFIGMFFVLFAVFIVPVVFYLLTLMRALEKCSPENRSQSPGLVWLEVIPFLGLVWQFVNVLAIGNSLGNEFRARRISAEPKPGQSLGLAMCITGVCVVIPFLNIFAAIAHLVLFIVYWVKVAGFSRQLDMAQPAPYAGYQYPAAPPQYGDYNRDWRPPSAGPSSAQPTPDTPPSEASSYCPTCATQVGPGDRFCKSCGSQIPG